VRESDAMRALERHVNGQSAEAQRVYRLRRFRSTFTTADEELMFDSIPQVELGRLNREILAILLLA